MTNRIIRDTRLSRKMKAEYGDRCQVCGQVQRVSRDRNYSEAHHLRPLGKPHDGPDVRAEHPRTMRGPSRGVRLRGDLHRPGTDGRSSPRSTRGINGQPLAPRPRTVLILGRSCITTRRYSRSDDARRHHLDQEVYPALLSHDLQGGPHEDRRPKPWILHPTTDPFPG